MYCDYIHRESVSKPLRDAGIEEYNAKKEKKFRHICPCDVINGKDSSHDDHFSGKGSRGGLVKITWQIGDQDVIYCACRSCFRLFGDG